MVELDTWIEVNERMRTYEFCGEEYIFHNVSRIKISSHGNQYLEFEYCEYYKHGFDEFQLAGVEHAIVMPHDHTVIFLDIDGWTF